MFSDALMRRRADGADRSWRQARTALRFTAPHRPVVHHRNPATTALLGTHRRKRCGENADVAAIDRLAAEPDDLPTLDAYCATGSRRRAAELLHLRLTPIGDGD